MKKLIMFLSLALVLVFVVLFFSSMKNSVISERQEDSIQSTSNQAPEEESNEDELIEQLNQDFDFDTHFQQLEEELKIE